MQEDPQGGAVGGTTGAMPASDGMEIGEEESGEEVDLDASVEDMDGDESGMISADE